MNAVAAGGTLLTFPTLVWLGLNSITANATSTVAVWPGVMSGVVAYRRELRTLERRFLYLAVPSLIGGLGGAYLLRLTPSTVFDRLVPYLILFATLLFMAQETIQHKMKDAHPGARKSTGWFLGAIVFQLIVGIYGGYFGAGIGILMLAAFGILGMTDIHQMNGFKNLLGGAINLLAAIYFISEKMVYWPDVGVMALGTDRRRLRWSRHCTQVGTHRGPADRDPDWIRNGGFAVSQALTPSGLSLKLTPSLLVGGSWSSPAG